LRSEVESKKKQNEHLRQTLSQMRTEMEQLASTDSQRSGSVQEKEKQIAELRYEMARLQSKQRKQEQEKTQLLELSNSLRSKLNRLEDEDEHPQQAPGDGSGRTDADVEAGRSPGRRRQTARASELETNSQRQSRRAKLREHTGRSATVRNYSIADDGDERAKVTVTPLQLQQQRKR
jgi:DNA repair exonuclease SbcCD ATPase subunit